RHHALGDGPAEARPDPARRHLADHRAVARANLGALAGERAALGAQAAPHARRTVGELVLHACRARKAALRATPFWDRPGEPRLDRRGRLVELVPVEA